MADNGSTVIFQSFADDLIEGDFNYLVLIGQGKDAPTASEWSLGMYYGLNRYRSSLGYRRYTLRKDDVRESYNDIEIVAGYRF